MIDLRDLANLPRRAVDLVREVAIEKNVRPFLVGGPVRDLLLGNAVSDIDVTVEDDSSTLARALAKKLNARVKSFPQFLTYKVIVDGMPAIDIATARRERYRTPGALPSVTPGKLHDDLLRRDFAMNAIAVDLIDGTLHDPTGGFLDLEQKVVRILHDASFEDDPTRVFRAIRLATRLGFTLEDRTAGLLARAVDSGALNTISRERIWRELFMAMDEIAAPAMLAEMVRAGALDTLFGRRAVYDAQLELAAKQIAAHASLDRYALYTSALLHGNASPLELEGSGFSMKRARNIMQIANELPRFDEALGDARSERQRMRVLRTASPELLALLAATRPERYETVERFQAFQTFTIPLRGNDLAVPGGPHVARALERTREAVFTGEIAADDARTFARELAIKYLKRETTADQK